MGCVRSDILLEVFANHPISTPKMPCFQAPGDVGGCRIDLEIGFGPVIATRFARTAHQKGKPPLLR